jgi:hypothetical protein
MSKPLRNKRNLIPVLKAQVLFSMLTNTDLTNFLKTFSAPGSIPPTNTYGGVSHYRKLYDFHHEYVISGTLKIATLVAPFHAGPGVVMENAQTGARYFMLPDEYKIMMDQVVSDHNCVQGSWSVFKQGHAFSLRWLTPTVGQE